MNIVVRYLIFLLFTITVGSAVADDIANPNIASIYQELKTKTDKGKKVRVIAWIKDAETSLVGSTAISQSLISARGILEQAGAVTKREFSRLGALALELDGYSLDVLVNTGVVENIQEDIPVPPTLLQSIDIIDADIAHADGFMGENQTVVILDTGIEADHPFFSNRVIEEACFSSNGDDATSLCPNGNETQIGTGAAADCSQTGASGCYHGTHVAGIAAGANDDIVGVAPAANIVAVQVFSLFPADYDSCSGVPCVLSYTSDQYAALMWVLNESTADNIAAVNVSLGGSTKYTSSCDSDIRASAISALKDAGIATVISSGNSAYDDGVSSPGCISYAITVGSTNDTTDTVSDFSNSSELVDILAPGEWIYSSVLDGLYDNARGTSMAAPHVTGAFAVMRALNDTASVADIEEALEANGVSITDDRNSLSFPRLDLYTSVIKFNGVPIASLDEDSYSVIVNSSTEFTAYSSSDPNNSPLTYIWDFGDGVSDYQTTTANVQHTYTDVGSYNIQLSTSNGSKYSDQNDTATVTVYDPAMIAIIATYLIL
ncbi:MAG: S8 family serine peptidase [Chromatiales bacterium]|jgi:hypothetical protein